MEKIFEQALLYDFYGELLTTHQQSIYEDAVYNDMSLGEIAQERGISRQGVHDLIRRCDKILQDYESKLHLVERFQRAKRKVVEIEALTRVFETDEAGGELFGIDGKKTQVDEAMVARMVQIRTLSEELLKEL